MMLCCVESFCSILHKDFEIFESRIVDGYLLLGPRSYYRRYYEGYRVYCTVHV